MQFSLIIDNNYKIGSRHERHETNWANKNDIATFFTAVFFTLK